MEFPSSSSASSSITMDSSSTSSVAILGKKGKAAGTGRTAARKAAEKEAALNRKQHLSAGFEAERGFTTNQRLRIAGIAQSRALSGMMSNRERQRAKGHIIRIQERRVKRQKELIEAKQFLIANMEANNPKRIFMMQELIDLHNKLQVLSDELDAAEESAIDDAMKMTSDSASTAQECADFIDLTIEQMMRGNEKMPPHYLQCKNPKMDDELSSVEGGFSIADATPRTDAEQELDLDSTPRTDVGRKGRDEVDADINVCMVPQNLAADEEKNESDDDH
jgi:hypothetical protein